MKTFVVCTPSYNRARLLPRLYQSLCHQTFKDFTWILVDDGSNDETANVVDGFIKENKIDIEYYYKPNGGKHTAWKEAMKYISQEKYQYFLPIDSDDEIVPEALEVFLHHWKDIDEHHPEVGLIKARTCVFGEELPYHPFYRDVEYRDECYQDVVFKEKVNFEMLTSIRVKDLYLYLHIPDVFWLSDKVKFYPEGVLWARAGRITKMRFLSKALRIVHQDAGNQVTNGKKKKSVTHLCNYIVGIRYYLPENLDYYKKYRPFGILKQVAVYGTMCQLCGIKVSRYSRELTEPLLKVLSVALSPVSYVGKLVYKLKR